MYPFLFWVNVVLAGLNLASGIYFYLRGRSFRVWGWSLLGISAGVHGAWAVFPKAFL